MIKAVCGFRPKKVRERSGNCDFLCVGELRACEPARHSLAAGTEGV